MTHASSAAALAPLSFGSVQFEVVDRNNQPWLRGYQIGTALGYSNQPDAAIRKIFDRNAAEFTDRMTALVKLPTEGGLQETRIFSLRGAHLLGMFARTAKAAEFRRWALDVLDRELDRDEAPVAPLSPTPPAAHRRQAQTQNRRAWTLTQALYPWVLERVQSGEAVPTADELRDLWRRGPSSGAGWPAGDRRVVGLRPDGTFSTAPLPKGALLCTPAELPRLIADANGGPFPCTLLPAIISAAADRLGKAVAFTTGPLSPPAGK